MKLIVLSNYGIEEKIVSESTNINEIKQIMKELDWNEFHQVILSIDEHNWIEVGGSFKEEYGFSIMYEENGKQYIINTAPLLVEQMTEVLVSYFLKDKKFKKENHFE